MVTHVRIDVFSKDGVLLLGEIHSVKVSVDGLLGIPQRLEVSLTGLLCFPSKEEAGDITNRGDPFSAICSLLTPGTGADTMSALANIGVEAVSKLSISFVITFSDAHTN